MVVADGEEDKNGKGSSIGSPRVGSSTHISEGRKEILEDIEPDESSVEREGHMNKGIVDDVGGSKDAHLDVQAPDQDGVQDQKKLANHEVVVSLCHRKMRRRGKEKDSVNGSKKRRRFRFHHHFFFQFPFSFGACMSIIPPRGMCFLCLFIFQLSFAIHWCFFHGY